MDKSNIKYNLTKRIKASNIFNCRQVIKKTYLRRKKEFKKHLDKELRSLINYKSHLDTRWS